MGKLMNYINDKILENEPNKNERLEEKQTKKKLKTAKAKLKETTEERDLYRDKYIAILEEKGDGFNQYLAYQNKANQAEADAEEARRCTNDIKKDLKDYDNIIKRLFNKEPITSLNKCDDYDNFLAYLMRLYASGKELPIKGIQDICKKLEITKSMIKKDSEYLYKVFGVDKWEIE